MQMVGLLLGGLGSLGGTATAGAAGAAGAAATAAGSSIGIGSVLGTLLQGTATVLGMMSTIEAGNQEGDMYDAKAIDAQAEKPLETLQGIERRASLKREMAEAIGERDVAFAASGVDLSFGTPAEARKDALREGDRALTSDNAVEETRLNRLDERSSQYRTAGRRARKAARKKALFEGISFGTNVLMRG